MREELRPAPLICKIQRRTMRPSTSRSGRSPKVGILETSKADGGTLSVGAASAFDDLKQRASFFVWPREKRPVVESGRAALHAKAAIADDHTALVTSANLTGFAIKDNMELGLLIRGGPVPQGGSQVTFASSLRGENL